MNQHEWVYSCYQYYLENYIEPGNPEDGVWEAAHWPVPGYLGGTKTILLLKEHHAVQGVLQSEEWGVPCVHCWEGDYLTGDLLARYKHWRAVHNSDAGKSARAKESHEVKSQRGREAIAKRYNNATPKQRSEWARNAALAQSHEQRVAAASAGAKVINAILWRCTVTGKVSTSGPLTNYQRAKGIDPKNRERVDG